jgi:hypothetical protein
LDNEEEESNIRELEFTKKDLESQTINITAESEQVAARARALRLDNMDMLNERDTLTEDIEEELEKKEKKLQELDEQYVKKVGIL